MDPACLVEKNATITVEYSDPSCYLGRKNIAIHRQLYENYCGMRLQPKDIIPPPPLFLSKQYISKLQLQDRRSIILIMKQQTVER
jgi:hypothetical protein